AGDIDPAAAFDVLLPLRRNGIGIARPRPAAPRSEPPVFRRFLCEKPQAWQHTPFANRLSVEL
ncbi:hypothetical protein, partial [Nocardia africana]